jgi:hypothetical protein
MENLPPNKRTDTWSKITNTCTLKILDTEVTSNDTYTRYTQNVMMLLSVWSVFLHGEGPRSRCYGRTTALRLIVQPCDEDEQFFYQVLQLMEHQWKEIDRGKPTTRRKTCPSATLSTTNPTWTDQGSNPSLRSGRPATNGLSSTVTNFTANPYFISSFKWI